MRTLFILTALAVAIPFQVRAQTVNCSDLTNPLWLQIGDTQEALVRRLGKDLISSPTHPMTIIYITSGSCANVPAIQAGTKITQNMLYIPPGYDGVSQPPTCTNAAPGHKIDVANAALFVSTCGTLATPVVTTTAQQGPIQAYTLVVPNGSSQTAITAEEAYFVFGFGKNDGFDPATTPQSPWNDETQMYIRTSTKSTLLTWMAALSVQDDATRTFKTATQFKGVPLAQSAQVESSVVAASPAEKGIGLLGAEVYDADRTKVKELAFQWFGQTHAYFPDSNSGAFDKRNLRDGHYAVWSPTYWLQEVDGTGVPVNANADFFINMILGKQVVDAINPIDDVIAVGLVPACAMQVNRTFEAGPLTPFAPTPSCSCYYDAHVKNGASSCATCSTTCASGVCRNGFCEAR